MPWPITHVLTAEIYFKPYFSHLDHKKFIVGTCFPDIRYPAQLPRKSTHKKHLSLSEIQSHGSFQAGVLFHSFVDEMWNQFVLHNNAHIFEKIPHNKPMIHTMKVLQDKFLYPVAGDWSTIAAYFDETLPEEVAFGASDEMIRQWHDLLANYFSKPPGIEDLEMLSISLPPELIDQISEYYRAYQDNQLLNHILVGYYHQVKHFHPDLKVMKKSRDF